jgi:biopolymer transport protein ExbB
MRLRLFATAALVLSLLPALAHAWWNEDWEYRKKITLNASASGADTRETVNDLPLLVRLHTGNFFFVDANEDGSDLRFVAADDKTPLPHHIEQWDPANELALIWVRVPKLAGGAAGESLWMYFGNKKAVAEDDARQRYDPGQTLVLHFNQQQGLPLDYSSYAHAVAESTASLNPQGPIDGAASFSGTSSIRIAAAPSLRINPQTGVTFSAWLRLSGPQAQASVFRQQGEGATVSVDIAGTSLSAAAGEARVQSAVELTPGSWHHVAASLGAGKLILYVDGRPAGEAAADVPDIDGDVVIGGGFTGDLDEVQLSALARPADWIKAAWAGQGADARLTGYGEDETTGSGGTSYFRILLAAVTIDGWVVIAILIVMFFLALAVMFGKGLFVSRTDRANRRFLDNFEDNPMGMLDPVHLDRKFKDVEGSPMYRLYRLGLRELKHRLDLYEQAGQAKVLSPQALGAIKASLDAGMVRESARLNSQMVLLTIAISGGPFLGLLGTVVGVMITFAAIAAVGDVNINSIAPGIAAALVATVAGLAVAIPALFGYNYLASRIKNLTNDMAVFADELVTRLAEKYAP